MKRLLRLFIIANCQLSIVNLVSCTTDSYDKGQGKYSLMQAELVELSINSNKEATSFTLDDGTQYTFVLPTIAKWIETPDTVYRALLYYNKVTETTAEPVSLGAVPTLRAREHWKLEEQPEDPVGVESAWLSKNGKYLNIARKERKEKLSSVDDGASEIEHFNKLLQDRTGISI